MKIIKETLKIQVTLSQILFLNQAALILLVRFQQWQKSELSNSLSSLITISSYDLVIAWVACLAICILTTSKRIIILSNILLALVLFFPVFFQLKMGLPLSLGLLSQVGGVFELKTSVADKSNFRNFIIFSILIAGFSSITFIIVHFKQIFSRLFNFLIPLGLVIIGIVITANFQQSSLEKKYSYTFLLRLLGDDELDVKLKNSRLLHNAQKLSLKKELIKSTSNKRKNLVVVVLETFDFSIVSDPMKFREVMPNFFRRSQTAHNYRNHYSPWPFSSKALYSIMCGKYPYPGKVIDLRVRANNNCDGWATNLNEAGFQLWSGYSGDFAYDRMGEFLSHQGNFHFEERKTLRRFDKEEWELGVDDQALVVAFEDFLTKRTKSAPFAGLLIPIGSHHPYWKPQNFLSNQQDEFLSSFQYQDQVLENLFVLLEKENLYEDTVIIITGDHGRREGLELQNNLIAGEMYHVPMFVFNDENNQVGITDHPTTHLDIKGTILRSTNVSGEIIAEHELNKSKDIMLIYDLEHTSFMLKTKENKAVLINLDSDSAFLGEEWVYDHTHPCKDEECLAQISHLKLSIESSKAYYEKP